MEKILISKICLAMPHCIGLRRKGNVQMAIALLARGANGNICTSDGVTPLHLAAAIGVTALCEALIKVPVQIDARNNLGQTPLHLSAQKNQGATSHLLLDAGADPDATEHGGMTPLELAEVSSAEQTAGVIRAWHANKAAKAALAEI